MSAEYSRSVSRAMQNVMLRVLNGVSFSQLSDTEKDYLYQCSKDGLISGLVFEQMISGRLVCEIRGAVKLTPAGESFIENLEEAERLKENLVEEKAKKVTEEKRIKRVDYLLNLVKALIASGSTLFYQHFLEIRDFIASIFQRVP